VSAARRRRRAGACRGVLTARPCDKLRDKRAQQGDMDPDCKVQAVWPLCVGCVDAILFGLGSGECCGSGCAALAAHFGAECFCYGTNGVPPGPSLMFTFTMPTLSGVYEVHRCLSAVSVIASPYPHLRPLRRLTAHCMLVTLAVDRSAQLSHSTSAPCQSAHQLLTKQGGFWHAITVNVMTSSATSASTLAASSLESLYSDA
jgi:hypothetical protein